MSADIKKDFRVLTLEKRFRVCTVDVKTCYKQVSGPYNEFWLYQWHYRQMALTLESDTK